MNVLMQLGQEFNKIKTTQKFCAICNTNIDTMSQFFTDGEFGIICKKCHDKFPEDDIKLMINLFRIHGGYFGQEKSDFISVKSLIKRFFSEIHGKFNIKELNIRILHKSLLYGISPKDHLENLKIIMDEFF